MRIAVSGTHCTGKSTLVEEFLRFHTDFVHEPEPYTVLVEDYGEEFSSEPSVDDFYRQLEFNIARLYDNSGAERVIYERTPVDFLAYILALKDLNRDQVGPELIETALALVTEAISNLDLIVFLPIDDVDMADAEDPRLRRAVNERLLSIFGDDEFGVVSSGGPSIVEARGSTTQRLHILEDAMQSHRLRKPSQPIVST